MFPQVGQDDPVIDFFVRQAAAIKAQTLSIYVAQQLEYGKYNRIVEFSEVKPDHCPTTSV